MAFYVDVYHSFKITGKDRIKSKQRKFVTGGIEKTIMLKIFPGENKDEEQQKKRYL